MSAGKLLLLKDLKDVVNNMLSLANNYLFGYVSKKR